MSSKTSNKNNTRINELPYIADKIEDELPGGVRHKVPFYVTVLYDCRLVTGLGAWRWVQCRAVTTSGHAYI